MRQPHPVSDTAGRREPCRGWSERATPSASTRPGSLEDVGALGGYEVDPVLPCDRPARRARRAGRRHDSSRRVVSTRSSGGVEARASRRRPASSAGSSRRARPPRRAAPPRPRRRIAVTATSPGGNGASSRSRTTTAWPSPTGCACSSPPRWTARRGSPAAPSGTCWEAGRYAGTTRARRLPASDRPRPTARASSGRGTGSRTRGIPRRAGRFRVLPAARRLWTGSRRALTSGGGAGPCAVLVPDAVVVHAISSLWRRRPATPQLRGVGLPAAPTAPGRCRWGNGRPGARQRFYLRLLADPLGREPFPRAVVQSALLAVTQVATAVGYLDERRRARSGATSRLSLTRHGRRRGGDLVGREERVTRASARPRRYARSGAVRGDPRYRSDTDARRTRRAVDAARLPSCFSR